MRLSYQRFKNCLVTFVLILLALFAPVHRVYADPPGNVRVVNNAASSGGNGQTWATAYQLLQNALKEARDNPGTIAEIWVAKSTTGYRPDQGTGYMLNTRDHSFNLVRGVKIFGGAIAGQDALDTPLPHDATGTNCTLTGEIGSSGLADNSYHVVTAFGTTPAMTPANTWLHGFTIRDGNGSGNSQTGTGYGGGGVLLADAGNARIINCIITDNRSGTAGAFDEELLPSPYGAGIQINAASPVFINCMISKNEVNTGAVIYGGGAVVMNGSNAKFIACTFQQNKANHGGGISIKQSSSTCDLINCLIIGNSTVGNQQPNGGGVVVDRTGAVRMYNCTVALNSAWRGGGLAQYDNPATPESSIKNSIFWGNTATIQGPQIWFTSGGGTLRIYNSDVQGGAANIPDVPPQTNINPLDVDPKFYNPSFTNGPPNFRLKCGSPVRNMGDNALVPCDEFNINNAGNNCTTAPNEPTPDRDRKTRIFDTNVDHGCYERMQDGLCNGDVNADGQVNIDDLVWVITTWSPAGCTPPCCTASDCIADIHPAQCAGNGVVNIDDLVIVITTWGTCPQAFASSASSIPTSFQECWDNCSAEFEAGSEKWHECMDACILSLCRMGYTQYCP